MKRKKVTDPVRIAVFVSGSGTNLQAMIDAQKKGILRSGKITLVLSSNHNAFALTRAAEAGIPTAVVSRKKYDSQTAFEDGIREAIAEHHIELIVLAGFMTILSEAFVREWPRRIINVHPSLIPSFCGKGFYGLRVHEAALEKGVKVTGATVHFVNEIPDGGEILLQKSVAIHKHDTPVSLQQRVMRQAEWILLPRGAEIVSLEVLASADRQVL